MKETTKKPKNRRGFSLLFPIVLIFCIFGAIVFAVSQKISREMSASAIQNLSESLDLMQSTIEAILRNEAEFQKLIAREIAQSDDPERYIRSYERNQTVTKISLILSGRTEGVSNTGELFTEEGLDFSAEGTISELPVSQSYLNYMGTWSYTIKCPVERDGQLIGTLYAEYTYDTIDESLPDGFYNGQASLYIMDAESQRFVLKPKGMGQRSAGHLNLTDFYRANSIQDPEIQAEMADCLRTGRNALFYHHIRAVDALNYMWAVNDGTIFLVGYVPVEAIQQEGATVNQNIMIVVASLLAAFFLCIALYYLNWRQQDKLRREQEAERRLHSQQLADALHAAQIASESKTTFLSNMSHDIRTPMNAVLGFTTLLAKDAENPVKVREYTGKITASGQHLLSLINDILDETRINQILINLLSNAVKYTQEGGHIQLRMLGLKQRSSQYERIRIEVEDDGYGMTPEYLETIFDAFTRAENSTTNKVQGTGLGMAITKSIVELMGGTIEVSSEVGRGSLFRVELELRVLEETADRQFWAQRGISRLLAAGGSPESWETLQTIVQDAGLRLDIVSGVKEALAQIRGGAEFQAVLVDWESCGLQEAGALREALPETVPLLLAAEFDAPGMEETLRLPRTDILTKPVLASALRARIETLWREADQPGAREPAESGSLEGLRLLAAEDNDINAEILGELLELEGASCEIAANGRLALERFRASAPGEFDAILMDVQMPVMNGHEAARAIRALDREDAGRIPIIAMTANAFTEDEKAALDAGMDAHVPKPLDMELLKKTLREYIGRKEGL